MPSGAAQLYADRLTAAVVLEPDAAAVLAQPAVAPLHQRGEHGEEIRALLGQPVAVAGALAGVAIRLALQKPVGDELAQARRDHGLARAGPRHEIVEPSRAVKGLAHDEHR